MKKYYWLFILVICTVFSSCFTWIPQTFKQNLSELPATESTVVLFDNAGSATFILKKCNDNDISEALYGKRLIDNNDKAELTVPPGNNSFTFDIFFDFGRTSYEKRNIELQYNLAAGNKYIVKARINSIDSGGKRLREFLVGIYSDEKKSNALKEWKLGEG